MNLELIKSFFVYNDLEKSLLSEYGDPPLVLKHSTTRSFTVAGVSLNIRLFQMPHHKAKSLPKLPIIFLIHGLGGQLNQFQSLIDNLSHFSEIVAIDLPGHGRSEYSSKWEVYTQESLVSLLKQVIEFCVDIDREIVLVGHSMGCFLSVGLARRLGARCLGLIAICPPGQLTESQRRYQPILGYITPFLFNIFRTVDRLGGLYSSSVSRLLYPTASLELRKKQLRWNLQSNTNTLMRTAYALTAPTPEEWHSLDFPVFLIGAEGDKVTPPENIDLIKSWLGPKSEDISHTVIHGTGHACLIERPEVICGLISDFITKYVDSKLSLGWQLAFFASKMDKWSLKNENKWRQVQPVSPQIEGTHFRAMKTLRQDDEIHSPSTVEKLYSDITDIIDISREAPPYDPTTFKSIIYHKFPTVSKLPPTREEVTQFINLVDGILENNKDAIISVHCHYGFNRTGFFLCCYMIERLGFSIKKALNAFQEVKPPGIKHSHFIDELYVRYEL